MPAKKPFRPWFIPTGVVERELDKAMLDASRLTARMCLDMASKMDTGALPPMKAPDALRLIARILEQAASEAEQEFAAR